jgi:argininosuccinate lyase
MKDTARNPMWGGHYQQGPSEIMQQINQSIRFDQRLYRQDIQASIVHCQMLAHTNILQKEESLIIINGLEEILQEIEEGHFIFREELEDIHMNVESRLKELVGDVAGKLHTARSRNDQVAVDFRLWVRDQLDIIHNHIKWLQEALILLAQQHTETILPGYTHLQHAQPITFAHHLLAYVEMLGRDRERINDCRKRLNYCPLGSAALAGTSFPIDRFYTANALGFIAPTENSLDSVSDRDFALEALSSLSICAMHLSRFAEEIILWMSSHFSFIRLSESFTSGSSIMPQKRNPDAAELIRAKTGRILGHFVGLLTVMKGLPLAYSKDMQEDKEPVFEAVDIIILALSAMRGMVQHMEIMPYAMRNAAEKGYITATDIADWLVTHLHIPFRQAHHITGQIVRLAESKQCQLHELSLQELQIIEPRITQDLLEQLTLDHSVCSRNSYGGTAPIQVKEALIRAKERFLKEE